jgi:F0F1-type ATP synthase membrane subunit c/vacuolar-type H+-ATPase subunit K
VNAAWIALGVGIAVAVAAFATSWVRPYQGVDLGTVSRHWMAQQRLGRKE